jgi:MFS family permease
MKPHNTEPAQSTANSHAGSTWEPFRLPLFRALFAAQLGSNIGNWMETVGAQWLLVHEPNASTLVALVQTADMLPFLFLALPAGVLADIFDRRAYLIAVHVFLAATAGLLAAVTFAGAIRPTLLLTLTFLEGAGSALAIPAWQAVVPDLVPRRQLAAAAALGGLNQNLARAIGPALAGVMVGHFGAASVFALNALTFFFGIAVMLVWRRPSPPAGSLGREPIVAALRAGTRYVRHSRIVRRLLLRVALFVVPAAALWALLPVVADRLLGLGASGYGILLGSLGVGAIAGALLLPRVAVALSRSRLVAGASVLYAAAMLVIAAAPAVLVAVIALVAAGAAWLTMLVHVNSMMQLYLPSWVRARGLAIYQLTFMGSQAVAAAVWGVVAEHAGIGAALGLAAAALVIGAATIVRWPIYDVTGLDSDASVYWPVPALTLEPEPSDGPVLVTVRYSVAARNVSEFTAAMEALGRARRRTGAVTWDLFRDGNDARTFVEIFTVPSWGEHLRQHAERWTGVDRRAEERAMALCEAPPVVHHLFATDAGR